MNLKAYVFVATKAEDPDTMYFITFRTLFVQPIGRKLKRVVFSAWNLSITCFPNLWIKPLSRKTFWI